MQADEEALGGTGSVAADGGAADVVWANGVATAVLQAGESSAAVLQAGEGRVYNDLRMRMRMSLSFILNGSYYK